MAEGSSPPVESSQGPTYGSFLSGVVLTLGTRLFMLAGLVGSSVVVARWLGPEGLGTLAVLNATVALALQIGSAGLPSANTYFIARDRQSLGPVWGNSVVFALVTGSVLAAGVVLLAKLKPSLFGGVPESLLTIAAFSIPFQLLMLLGFNVLLAMGRIGQLNLLDAIAPTLALVNAIVVLAILRAKLTILVSVNTVTAIVLSFGMLLVIGRILARQPERRAGRADFRLLKKMLGYAVKFYISIMAGVVVFRADLLIVNHFRGAREAGIYAVASQVSFLLLMLPGVIGMLLFPRVASTQDPRGEFAIQVTRHASFVMLIVCVAAAMGSFALPLIYGAAFADATIQLLILLPGVYLMGLESVLVQHFTGTGLPPAIPVFWLITLTVNLGLNLALVPTFGARGAAVTSTLTYALIFGLVTFYFCLKTGRRPLELFVLRRYELREVFAMSRIFSRQDSKSDIKQEGIEDLWGYAKRLRFVREAIGAAFPQRTPNSLRVLDVGCGNGSQLALPLAIGGSFELTGIDPDAQSIAHAKELAGSRAGITFLHGRVEDLAADELFDVVILSEVLEHLESPAETLAASLRVMNADGILIVTVPNGYGGFEIDSWIFRRLRLQKVVDALAEKREVLGATDNPKSEHIQFFTRSRLRRLFENSGLVSFREGSASFLPGPIVGHVLARSTRLINWNSRVTDRLPFVLAGGWYFALRRRGQRGPKTAGDSV